MSSNCRSGATTLPSWQAENVGSVRSCWMEEQLVTVWNLWQKPKITANLDRISSQLFLIHVSGCACCQSRYFSFSPQIVYKFCGTVREGLLPSVPASLIWSMTVRTNQSHILFPAEIVHVGPTAPLGWKRCIQRDMETVSFVLMEPSDMEWWTFVVQGNNACLGIGPGSGSRHPSQHKTWSGNPWFLLVIHPTHIP